jgi:glycosyltransferase involved in cell wall biosynthesis
LSNLISILIPAYNAEKWIIETIESAICQTYAKKEIIIVDDGSTDNTLQIANKYQSKFVKVLSQKNKGASAARNKALGYAQGDYIQWLDADDLLATDKIEEQMIEIDVLKNSKILLSSSYGKFYYRPQKAKFSLNKLWQDLDPVEWLMIKFTENLWMIPGAWLVSRKLTELAGPWDERLSYDDDGEYFARVVGLSDKIKFVSKARSYYRVGNPNSLSRALSDKAYESLYLSKKLCITYLRSLEDSKRTREACLKFLQFDYACFYPEHKALLQKTDDLATELGGKLSPPALDWKYSIIKKVFGWGVAKRAQQILPMIKVSPIRNWDKMLYNLSHNGMRYMP